MRKFFLLSCPFRSRVPDILTVIAGMLYLHYQNFFSLCIVSHIVRLPAAIHRPVLVT